MSNSAEQKTADWMTTKWRPLMAVTYMATIWFDFIVGPILFNILQYMNPGQAISTWTPLTLQGGGLYHLSMGAILGIAAWTRGKEKEAMINNGINPNEQVVVQQPVMMAQPVATPAPAAPAAYTPPAYTPPAPAAVATSSTGKAMPVQPAQDVL